MSQSINQCKFDSKFHCLLYIFVIYLLFKCFILLKRFCRIVCRTQFKSAGDLNQDLPCYHNNLLQTFNDTSTLYRDGSFKTTGSFWCLFKTPNSQTTLCALSRPCWHSFHSDYKGPLPNPLCFYFLKILVNQC